MNGAAGRPAPATSLRRRRQALLDVPGLGGPELARRAAALADEWLADLFSRVVGPAGTGGTRGVSLVAVGGLGRGELLPGSDLDLVLVHDRRKDADRLAERLWYPLWDDGLGVDHSVRTLGEIAAAADGDLRVALGLLDARCVAGDADLADRVLARVADRWKARRKRWSGQLIAAVAARHDHHGDVAFLLEPDLKEGRGGLRDVHALRAMAKVVPVLDGVLADPALDAAAGELTGVLVALQALTAPGGTAAHRTRLLLQDQDAVASRLGATDADELMSRVAGAARAVAWAGDDGWRRLRGWLAGRRGRRPAPGRPVGPGLVWRSGEIVVLAGDDSGAGIDTGADIGGHPATRASLPLRAAIASVEHGAPIARASLDRLSASTPDPGDPWPDEVRLAWVRLLGAGPGAIAAIEALDQWGLLVRLIPEWATVRNRPQRNAYHRFTVDRHLLETAVAAGGLVDRVARPDLLLVGALLHDIGKGAGGGGRDAGAGGQWDHSEAGASIAGALAVRMGFCAEDAATIATMARHHLLLPDLATRRDLADPATAAAVADVAGDQSTLELLAALAEADGVATGPAAWGRWKAGLVATLVERAGALLAGSLEAPPPAASLPTPAQERLLATAASGDGVAIAGDDRHVDVVAPDERGLLGVVAGVLALHGVDVRAATSRAAGGGQALIDLDVVPAWDVLPPWERVRADIVAARAGQFVLADRLARQEVAYRRSVRARQAAAPEVAVSVHPDASATATAMEVRAPDASGALSRIAGALADCGLEIVSARATTVGAEVVDAFYVKDAGGAKLTDEGAREAADAITRALGGR